jgi:hypothetical protein
MLEPLPISQLRSKSFMLIIHREGLRLVIAMRCRGYINVLELHQIRSLHLLQPALLIVKILQKGIV